MAEPPGPDTMKRQSWISLIFISVISIFAHAFQVILTIICIICSTLLPDLSCSITILRLGSSCVTFNLDVVYLALPLNPGPHTLSHPSN